MKEEVGRLKANRRCHLPPRLGAQSGFLGAQAQVMVYAGASYRAMLGSLFVGLLPDDRVGLLVKPGASSYSVACKSFGFRRVLNCMVMLRFAVFRQRRRARRRRLAISGTAEGVLRCQAALTQQCFVYPWFLAKGATMQSFNDRGAWTAFGR